MPHVIIHTDGACKGNPGRGGWGAILQSGAHEKELWGAEPETTNNRMEMTAAIMALEALKKPSDVDLYTDSKYVMQGITEWIGAGNHAGGRPQTRSPSRTRISGVGSMRPAPATG